MDNKIPFIQWTLDKWKYVKVIKFHVPYTRSTTGAEIVYTIPFTMATDLMQQIDKFVLEAVKSYDPQAVQSGYVVNNDEQKVIVLSNHSHCNKTTFTVYNNPNSEDVCESVSIGRTSWWSFRAQFNVYVNPYVDEIDFEVYKNSGAFMTYRLEHETETEKLMQEIWDNVKTIEEL